MLKRLSLKNGLLAMTATATLLFALPSQASYDPYCPNPYRGSPGYSSIYGSQYNHHDRRDYGHHGRHDPRGHYGRHQYRDGGTRVIVKKKVYVDHRDHDDRKDDRYGDRYDNRRYNDRRDDRYERRLERRRDG